VPDVMIAPLTMECDRNLRNHHIVEVTSGPFEQEPVRSNPHSGESCNNPDDAVKHVADLETDSVFCSAYRDYSDSIAHTRNN
jgi:hypothetical protein